MRKPLVWSLAAGLLLAGSVATGAYAAGPSGTSTPSVTTQTQTTATTQTQQDVQSGVQAGSQSQTGLDTEQAVAKTPEADSQAAASAVDPAGGPNQNVQQGAQLQSGGQDGTAGGQ